MRDHALFDISLLETTPEIVLQLGPGPIHQLLHQPGGFSLRYMWLYSLSWRGGSALRSRCSFFKRSAGSRSLVRARSPARLCTAVIPTRRRGGGYYHDDLRRHEEDDDDDDENGEEEEEEEEEDANTLSSPMSPRLSSLPLITLSAPS